LGRTKLVFHHVLVPFQEVREYQIPLVRRARRLAEKTKFAETLERESSALEAKTAGLEKMVEEVENNVNVRKRR
jgi:hypothetical protein